VDRQQQGGIVDQPLLGILATALGAMPIVAGMIAEVSMVALRTMM
jgi:hypothetical protein